MMLRALAFTLAVVALEGCGTAGSVRLTAGQGLLVAEAGVDGINNASVAAASTGLLKGAAATKVKKAVDVANTATSAAYAAYNVGDQATVTQELAAALAAIADAKGSIPGAPVAAHP